MRWSFHLLTLALTTSFFVWAIWLANSRKPPTCNPQIFRTIWPFRILALILVPWSLWASWHEWGKTTGLIFLIIAIGCVPLAACAVTLKVTLDNERIRLRHAFANKQIRYEEVTEARLRDWTGEYVISSRDGTKIVFPICLENADYVIERCRVK